MYDARKSITSRRFQTTVGFRAPSFRRNKPTTEAEAEHGPIHTGQLKKDIKKPPVHIKHCFSVTQNVIIQILSLSSRVVIVRLVIIAGKGIDLVVSLMAFDLVILILNGIVEQVAGVLLVA